MRNLECISSANCMQLYVFLFFLALTSTKKRPHTLHRSSILCVYLYYEIIHKNSCLILRLKKKAAIYERYVYTCTLLCVLIIILLAYRFLPVGSSTKTAQVHPVFSRQSCIDMKTGCAEPLIINVVLGQLWLMYSCGRASVFMSIFSPWNVIRLV